MYNNLQLGAYLYNDLQIRVQLLTITCTMTYNYVHNDLQLHCSDLQLRVHLFTCAITYNYM